MNFLAPTFLALAALAAPIILLYMLRLRRREVTVSSTLLWQRLMRDREANAPWQRLRRNLLLLLQLLILAALVIALARPFAEVPSVASGNVALLIDASASMNATDTRPGHATRFEAARAAALRLVNELAVDETMSLILVGPSPRVLNQRTGDKATLRTAINSAVPSQASADWEAAFALAAASAQEGEDFSMVVIGDGGLPDELPALPGETHYVPVGDSNENLAVSALAARPTQDGIQLFAAVTNYGEEEADVIFDIEVDGNLHSAQELSVRGGQTEDLTITDLPPNASNIRAGLSLPSDSQNEDYLALDNYAWTTFSPPRTIRTLLMSPGSNLFLEQLLVALADVEAFRAPRDGSLPETQFDLYIFDGMLPERLPEQGNLLIINPPVGDGDLLTVSSTFENTHITRIASDASLLAFVDLDELNVLDAHLVEVPAWGQVLVEAEGGPLLIAGEQANRQVVLLTFDLRRSDLPLRVAFPVLMSNLLAEFATGQIVSGQDSFAPGQLVSIRLQNETTAVMVTRPDGGQQSLPLEGSVLQYATTDLLGLYQVMLEGEEISLGGGAFAVNLFAPQESDIAPRETITLGSSQISAAIDEGEVGQRELWPWLALAGLLLLMVEWYAYHRGATLPSASGLRRTRMPRLFGRRTGTG